MTLKDIISSIKESEICKLKFEGKVLGLRVKNFNVNTLQFDYFDFELDVIKDKEIINFVKGLSDMKSISLRKNRGFLVSEAEMHNNVVIKEFEDTYSAETVLKTIMNIYKYKSSTKHYTLASIGTEDTDKTRVFYTIELESGKYVDVMCIRDGEQEYEYVMQCGDGNDVYDSDQNTYEGYEYDEELCYKIACEAYDRDYNSGD